MAKWLAVGIAVRCGVGVATNHLAVGVAVGTPVGLLFGRFRRSWGSLHATAKRARRLSAKGRFLPRATVQKRAVPRCLGQLQKADIPKGSSEPTAVEQFEIRKRTQSTSSRS